MKRSEVYLDREDKIKQLEKEIRDLRARLPAHSVKPAMLQELESLEEQLDILLAEQKTDHP
jgi:restriction endonuclease S subunit